MSTVYQSRGIPRVVECSLARQKVKKKFKLKDMVYNGKLEL